MKAAITLLLIAMLILPTMIVIRIMLRTRPGARRPDVPPEQD